MSELSSRIRSHIRGWIRPPQRTVFQKCLETGRASMGHGSYGHPLLYVFEGDTTTKLRIGAYCSIAADVRILLGGEHRIDWVTTSPLRILNRMPQAGLDGHPHSEGDVSIANDVWIGVDATILSGVTIGNGAVVGAGAVVASDVPSYAVVVGNPARIARFRFDPQIIEALERIAWWDWPPQKVLDATNLLCSSEVERFVERFDRSV